MCRSVTKQSKRKTPPTGGDMGRLVVLETHPSAQREICRFESGSALHSCHYPSFSPLFSADSRERPATRPNSSMEELRLCNLGVPVRVRVGSPAPHGGAEQFIFLSLLWQPGKTGSPGTRFDLRPGHTRRSSSVGRAPAFQAGCRGFEPRLRLQWLPPCQRRQKRGVSKPLNEISGIPG